MPAEKKVPTVTRSGTLKKEGHSLKEKPSVGRETPRSIAAKKAFLAAYADCGVIRDACKIAGVATSMYYYWTRPSYYDGMYYDEEFVELVELAHEQYCDRIRAEIDRRAIDGVETPVFGSLGDGQGSGEIGTVVKYSDRLLELAAKMHLPEAKAMTNGGGTSVNVDARQVNVKSGTDDDGKIVFDPRNMTKEQRKLMREFLAAGEKEPIEGEVVA